MATFISKNGGGALLKDGTVLEPGDKLTKAQIKALDDVSVDLVDDDGNVVRAAEDSRPRRRLRAIRKFQAGKRLTKTERALLDDETWGRLNRERDELAEREKLLKQWMEAGD